MYIYARFLTMTAKNDKNVLHKNAYARISDWLQKMIKI